MKKTIFLSILLVAIVVNLSAQSYSINKLKYDYHQYVPEYGDYYNPGISGVCSFIVPGLGQMICGETGRGLAFFGGYVGCAVLFEVGAAKIVSNSWDYGNNGYYTANSNAGVGTMLVGLGGMAIVSIWSIIDAVHVAKVNNMYIRNLRRTSSIKLEMSPYVEQLSINNQVTTPVGMTMRVKF
jgi:TM2 domain-containing membrane protein YozV